MIMITPDRIKIDFHPFVEDSVRRRLSQIVLSVVEKNKGNDVIPSSGLKKLEQASREIHDLTFTIEEITDSDGGPDWSSYAQKYAENYMYRYILKYTDYFNNGLDPFLKYKREAVANGKVMLVSELDKNCKQDLFDTYRKLLLLTLTANRADLSLSAGKSIDVNNLAETIHDFLLIDHIKESYHKLKDSKSIIIVIDNSGIELFQDLIFTKFLLDSFPKMKIALHCKAHPVFVSDAIEEDVVSHISELAAITIDWDTRAYLSDDNKRLEIFRHEFYNSPLSFHEAPEDLKFQLFSSDMVITKGDANYRRLLNDSVWQHNFAFQDVTRYFETALLAVRTCKAPIIVGLSATQEQRIKKLDENFLVNGRYGIIQFKE